MKKTTAVHTYYILPCCLLLLNLCNTLISYKASVIQDRFLRTGVIILFVILGSSLVAYALAPGIELLVKTLHRESQRGAGSLGEFLFLLVLGGVIFCLYYQVYINGPQAILPHRWWNPQR